jgi:hypothetical protein
MKLETLCIDTELTCKVKYRELSININVSHSLRYQGKCIEVFCTVREMRVHSGALLIYNFYVFAANYRKIRKYTFALILN